MAGVVDGLSPETGQRFWFSFNGFNLQLLNYHNYICVNTNTSKYYITRYRGHSVWL